MQKKFYLRAVFAILATVSLSLFGLRGFAHADTYAGSCYDATSDTFTCYDPATIEPETIPLWGPSWQQATVTYEILQSHGVTPQAISAVERAVAGWNAAIATITNTDFLVSPNPGETAQIVIRPKAGGGSVQGQALASTDADGFFTGCKVNVSGKAFGSTNDTHTVESIALQEIGHCLGLLHSENSSDVMYGYVQSPANTWISYCDLDAWQAVMAWMFNSTPVPALPSVDSVSCGSSSPTNGLPENVDVSTDKTSYVDHERVNITVHVDDGTDPVSGAAVTVTLTTAKGRQLSGNATTDGSGDASLYYDVKKGRDGAGTYRLTAEACKSGTCAESVGETTFEVN